MRDGVAPLPQPSLSGFNYRRDPALMMAEEPTPPATITIQDARTASTASLRRPHCGEPHLHAASATSSSCVPPMAIPYIALHNVGWKDSNFKGRKWVIMPMVAGFESTFIANTLQGLLCLPGCESAMMGESAVTSSSDGCHRHCNVSALGQDDSRRWEESGAVLQSSRSSSLAELPPQPQPQQAHETAADDDDSLEQHSHARSASPDGADEHSLSSSVMSDPMATEDRTARSLSEEGGDAGKDSGTRRAEAVKSRDAGRSPQALRGGIRSQWGTRVKTAASRTYAAYVMQHLSDANIQLRTLVPHDELPSDAPVTDTQVDDAEELESLRGQSATVPRCLAPVTLPREPRAAPQVSGGSGAGKSRAHVSIFLAHEAKGDEVCTSACRTTAAAGAEPSERSVTTTTVAPAAMLPGTASATAIDSVPPPEKAAVLMGLEEGHSSDDNNSPTPSSREEEEEEELWMTTEDTNTGQAGGAAPNAEVTRMANRQVAQDGSRYTCFASNCVDNMPNYPLPQLQSEDLVDLATFMVVRSSLQPDEATDLHLGTHVLGNPQNVRLLPPEQRAALMNRAARLMEAAVFLQV
ncbi:hypothetical protein LMXM_04_0920 [Leishmania mexicana MHOM/GT/2001/U1103]|uniref:Uncharacterized protein n=1 Tax=Leishmania mexicana (strain MHOM/GT/2001/U1103) TaxID=929439 RepID=E9AK73_LEIMU|nr:hypothetical protein LMXM_04_0920 [Leishmania mexicana MHOM/GT/2001/U1103]CBZ23323.1 hypothetical protein LMXM_04_0920 [Leishmania mexicana MHOM/GT/2001/U1103]